ncbi:hypothetical protein BSZ20_00420 [Bradyrhizobium canariense]|nr:hypothetical protein BSZ20_00420 [Bradyrhizobium canariense]
MLIFIGFALNVKRKTLLRFIVSITTNLVMKVLAFLLVVIFDGTLLAKHVESLNLKIVKTVNQKS